MKSIPEAVARRTFAQMQADRDDQAVRHFAEMQRLLERDEPDYAT